jgi:hypothetical protein
MVSYSDRAQIDKFLLFERTDRFMLDMILIYKTGNNSKVLDAAQSDAVRMHARICVNDLINFRKFCSVQFVSPDLSAPFSKFKQRKGFD